MLQKTILEITDDWIDISSSGSIYIAPSKTIAIQNQSSKPFILQQSLTKPSIDDYTGEIITNLTNREASKIITSEEDLAPCWIRNVKKGEGSIRLHVWEWIFDGTDSGAMMLLFSSDAVQFNDEVLSF